MRTLTLTCFGSQILTTSSVLDPFDASVLQKRFLFKYDVQLKTVFGVSFLPGRNLFKVLFVIFVVNFGCLSRFALKYFADQTKP